MLRIKNRKIAMSLLFLSLLLLGGCKNGEEEQEVYGTDLIMPEQIKDAGVQEGEVSYTTIQPELGEFVKNMSMDASLYYPVTAELFCEKDNADIREILVTKGQEVKKGDVLITFDIKVSDAEIQELSLKLTRHLEAVKEEQAVRMAALQDAEAEAEGLSGHEREIALLKVKKLQMEYDEFVYLSEHQAAQYRAELEELENERKNNTLTAPFDGVIDYVEPCNIGDRAGNGQMLVRMYTAEQYCLAVEDIAGNLRYNMDITVTAGPKNDTKTYNGKVVSAYNVLTPAVPAGKVLIRLEEEVAAEDLQVALQCHGDIEKLQNVLLIDRKVIGLEEEKSYVRVLEGDMIQKRYIVPGLRNTKNVWIADGLSEGQNVIAK